MRSRTKWFWVWPSTFKFKGDQRHERFRDLRTLVPTQNTLISLRCLLPTFDKTSLLKLSNICVRLMSRNLPSFKISIEAQAKDIVSSQYQFCWVEHDHWSFGQYFFIMNSSWNRDPWLCFRSKLGLSAENHLQQVPLLYLSIFST